MRAAAASGARDALARFRTLLNITIAATFVLVLIGGVVRVSDSGLGCGPAGSGTHGWPLCEGGILPSFLEGSTAIEFSHRVAAAVVTILIVALIWIALRQLRDRPWLVRGTIAAGVLILIQAGLGGATVENNLAEELVAAHLGLAMLLLGLLIATRRAAEAPEREPASPAAGESRGLRGLAALAATLLLATIVAGGLVAGTEKEGAEGVGASQGAHTACGDQFPTCNDELLPFGTSRLVDIQLTHRVLMFLASIALIAFAVAALRRGLRSRAVLAILAILAVQVLLGAINVWVGEHAGLIVLHLATGTLLWMTTIQAAMQLLPVPAPTGAQARSGSREEAAAAA
jgi:heme A synthase